MTLRLDHVVILVDDLERASADYGALGFTVVYGGEHADEVTENALVAFEDGSYLELIHFKRLAPEGHFFERGYRAGEGLIAYALVPDDIERAIAEARERGLEMDGPRAGGRLRPDGTRLEWKIGTPRTPDLPFLCADVTPRELRVPGGKGREHENGVVGITDVDVFVHDIVASAQRYSALLGVKDGGVLGPEESRNGFGSARFQLGKTQIALVQPTYGSPFECLEARGEGPASLDLRIDRDIEMERFDAALTHGVDIVGHGWRDATLG